MKNTKKIIFKTDSNQAVQPQEWLVKLSEKQVSALASIQAGLQELPDVHNWAVMPDEKKIKLLSNYVKTNKVRIQYKNGLINFYFHYENIQSSKPKFAGKCFISLDGNSIPVFDPEIRAKASLPLILDFPSKGQTMVEWVKSFLQLQIMN